tara:strand:- start:214 stop:402 length:189 start_codon:yes stop_codon:yes gene_type:complete
MLAAESGRFRAMFRVKRDFTSASERDASGVRLGTSNTSEYVKPTLKLSIPLDRTDMNPIKDL